MHFLPRWLKRHSFSCGVSTSDPTFACRRCGGCPLIIGDQLIAPAPTVTLRWDPETYINNPSVIRGLPPTPLTPVRFIPGVQESVVPQNVRRIGVQCDVPLLFKIRSELRRLSEDWKRWKLSWEVRPPQSPEPVPSNMAVVGRLHYLGMGGAHVSKLCPT